MKLAYVVRAVAGRHPCHFVWNGVAACFLRDIRVPRGPVGVVVYGSGMSQYLRMRGRPTALCHIMSKADLVMRVSEHWVPALEQHGRPPEKLQVDHMGVDVGALPHPPPTQAALAQTAVRSGLPLASIGRLTAKKESDTGTKRWLDSRAGVPPSDTTSMKSASCETG